MIIPQCILLYQQRRNKYLMETFKCARQNHDTPLNTNKNYDLPTKYTVIAEEQQQWAQILHNSNQQQQSSFQRINLQHTIFEYDYQRIHQQNITITDYHQNKLTIIHKFNTVLFTVLSSQLNTIDQCNITISKLGSALLFKIVKQILFHLQNIQNNENDQISQSRIQFFIYCFIDTCLVWIDLLQQFPHIQSHSTIRQLLQNTLEFEHGYQILYHIITTQQEQPSTIVVYHLLTKLYKMNITTTKNIYISKINQYLMFELNLTQLNSQDISTIELQQLIFAILQTTNFGFLEKCLNFNLFMKLLEAGLVQHARICMDRIQGQVKYHDQSDSSNLVRIYGILKEQWELYQGET